MKVAELIELLENFDEDMEVRVAYQSNYPLRALVQNVTTVEADEDWDEEENAEDTGFVWIALNDYVSHNESPYAPKAAWD